MPANNQSNPKTAEMNQNKSYIGRRTRRRNNNTKNKTRKRNIIIYFVINGRNICKIIMFTAALLFMLGSPLISQVKHDAIKLSRLIPLVSSTLLRMNGYFTAEGISESRRRRPTSEDGRASGGGFFGGLAGRNDGVDLGSNNDQTDANGNVRRGTMPAFEVRGTKNTDSKAAG